MVTHDLKAKASEREEWVDSLRGFAIFLMVPANLAPFLNDHSFFFRLFSSLAAPIFLTLVGLMLARNAQKHTITYYVQRGALILICGAVVDLLAWGALPFTYFDILHLIGLMLPIAYLANKLSSEALAACILLILILTPVLQNSFGYTPLPSTYDYSGKLMVDPELVRSGILQHFLIDGFFPVFPWLAFIIFGLLLKRLHWNSSEKIRVKFRQSFAPAVFFLILLGGSSMWYIAPGQLMTREGYSELFYNPTIGFVVAAIGATGLLYWLFFSAGGSPIFAPLRVLGEASLFMYLFHQIAIGHLKHLAPAGLNGQTFWVAYIVLLPSMLVIGVFIRLIKTRMKPQHYLVQFILGG